MKFNFEKSSPEQESLHPIDIVLETKTLLETYGQLFKDTVSDIRKLRQQQVFSKSAFNPDIMNNPGDHIDNPELSTEDLEKKIIDLDQQKNQLLDHIEKLAEKVSELKKQLSVDPRLN